jgi:hypothetical protein
VIATRHPRLVAPAVTVVLGSAIALGGWIGTGWGAALAVELVTVIGACAYYLLGGRDSDVGALFGSRPDERQTSIGMRATALTGNVMILVAIGGVVIATATGSSAWPSFSSARSERRHFWSGSSSIEIVNDGRRTFTRRRRGKTQIRTGEPGSDAANWWP